MSDPEMQERLRALPSVEELLQTEPLRSAAAQSTRPLAVTAARLQIERCRMVIRDGDGVPDRADLASAATATLEQLEAPSLHPVINATGVVVHTNLGRAPLADSALAAIEQVGRGYSNLEFDLEHSVRGSRQVHVEKLICELTGAEAAFAVNNNAAAVMLAVAAIAQGSDVLISRGQLVEIGGSFRIPEILAASGARLVEVGTTNRTRLEDYDRAVGDQTAALMRVHQSNFRTVGFTEDVSVEDLCELARRRRLVMIDDLGSGVIAGTMGHAGAGERADRLAALIEEEPAARRSVAAGADLVCFSGDKLLGGPQAGVVAGRKEAVERLRSHPVARAVRIDKLSLAALESTLRLYREPRRAVEEIPVLRMLTMPEAELEARATRLRELIEETGSGSAEIEVVRTGGRVGGGALPLLELEGPAVSVRLREGRLEQLRARLHAHDPPIIARAHEGALLLDPRTMGDDELEVAAAGVRAALSS